MNQCGDCNRILKAGEVLYNIGFGQGIWVCEQCFKTTISEEDLSRFEQIKESTPRRVVEGPSSARRCRMSLKNKLENYFSGKGDPDMRGIKVLEEIQIDSNRYEQGLMEIIVIVVKEGDSVHLGFVDLRTADSGAAVCYVDLRNAPRWVNEKYIEHKSDKKAQKIIQETDVSF